MSLDNPEMSEFLRLARGGAVVASAAKKTPDGAVAAKATVTKPPVPKQGGSKVAPSGKDPDADKDNDTSAAGDTDKDAPDNEGVAAVKAAAEALKKAKASGDKAAIEKARLDLVTALRTVAKSG